MNNVTIIPTGDKTIRITTNKQGTRCLINV